uniref:Zinc finger and BTB domain-containing protein 9 n=1 Tax=Homo sapiens TaxID=9606 RepID=UPI003467EE97
MDWSHPQFEKSAVGLNDIFEAQKIEWHEGGGGSGENLYFQGGGRNPAPRTIQIEFPQHSSSLLESLNRHRLEGKFCDVSLLVQGRELRAHKAVLAAASPYFHDKLLLGDAPRLTLPSVIEADAFEGLLQLIYSGRLRLPLDALPAHLLVASGLQMWQVVDQCSEILRELETSGGGI